MRILFEFDERQRRAISHHFGGNKPAERARCINFVNACVHGVMNDLLVEYDRDTEGSDETEATDY